MEISNMKNIVVLKNLPSNIVEEAFVVIKPKIKIKHFEYAEKNSSTRKIERCKENDYILKEAELIINNYSKVYDNKNKRGIEQKYKIVKKYSVIMTILFFLSVIFSYI